MEREIVGGRNNDCIFHGPDNILLLAKKINWYGKMMYEN